MRRPPASPDVAGVHNRIRYCLKPVTVGSHKTESASLHGNAHMSRPLAGTRQRGRTPEEDAALEADLLADEKERAEHIMLLDLGRNDVGRVSVAGSVKVRLKLLECCSAKGAPTFRCRAATQICKGSLRMWSNGTLAIARQSVLPCNCNFLYVFAHLC